MAYKAEIVKKSGGWYNVITNKGWVLFKTRDEEKAEKYLQGIKDLQELYKR